MEREERGREEREEREGKGVREERKVEVRREREREERKERKQGGRREREGGERRREKGRGEEREMQQRYKRTGVRNSRGHWKRQVGWVVRQAAGGHAGMTERTPAMRQHHDTDTQAKRDTHWRGLVGYGGVEGAGRKRWGRGRGRPWCGRGRGCLLHRWRRRFLGFVVLLVKRHGNGQLQVVFL